MATGPPTPEWQDGCSMQGCPELKMVADKGRVIRCTANRFPSCSVAWNGEVYANGIIAA